MSALTDVLHSLVDALTIEGNPARQELHAQVATLEEEVVADVKKDLKSLLEDNG